MAKILPFIIISFVMVSAQDAPEIYSAEKVHVSSEYFRPRWSPSGERIALTSPNYAGIYIYDLVSESITQISNHRSAGFFMTWSPDGQRIASTVSEQIDKSQNHTAVVYWLNEPKEQIISTLKHSRPYQIRWGSRNDLAIRSNEVTEFIQIEGAHPDETAKSPVYFSEGNRVLVYEWNNTTKSVVYKAEGDILNLTVSPDRRHLAFEVLGGNIWVVNSDGSHTRELGKGNRPRWSPDGKQLVFMQAMDDGHSIVESDIFIINSDGTGLINFTRTTERIEIDPDWSPDGKRIIYTTVEGEVFIHRMK
jgi:Tol biopolymer transport system component